MAQLPPQMGLGRASEKVLPWLLVERGGLKEEQRVNSMILSLVPFQSTTPAKRQEAQLPPGVELGKVRETAASVSIRP